MFLVWLLVVLRKRKIMNQPLDNAHAFPSAAAWKVRQEAPPANRVRPSASYAFGMLGTVAPRPGVENRFVRQAQTLHLARRATGDRVSDARGPRW
jgi:hypothetical protein